MLLEAGIENFDSWVSTFAEAVTEVEVSNDGTSFTTRTLLSRFRNVPELLRMWAWFTDAKTRDDLNLPTPDLVGGRPEMVQVPTVTQQAIITGLPRLMGRRQGRPVPQAVRRRPPRRPRPTPGRRPRPPHRAPPAVRVEPGVSAGPPG
jgi:hypothetical protein